MNGLKSARSGEQSNRRNDHVAPGPRASSLQSPNPSNPCRASPPPPPRPCKSAFKPANLSLGSSVGRSTRTRVDRPFFLLFVRAVLPEKAPEAQTGRSPEVGGQVLTRTSCSPRLHCAEWSCVVLGDSPRHHNGSGRDWPDKSTYRRMRFGALGPPQSRNGMQEKSSAVKCGGSLLAARHSN